MIAKHIRETSKRQLITGSNALPAIRRGTVYTNLRNDGTRGERSAALISEKKKGWV